MAHGLGMLASESRTQPRTGLPLAGDVVVVERRKDRRLPVQVLVEYSCTEDFIVDYTANISIGGMFVQTTEPLDLGARFRLRFVLMDHRTSACLGREIDTMATVCWVQRPGEAEPLIPGMGIRFDALNDVDRRFVEALSDLQ